MTMNASQLGLSSVIEDRTVTGIWSRHLQQAYFVHLELLTMFLMLNHFLLLLQGYNVLLTMDDMTVVSYNNSRGIQHFQQLTNLACKLLGDGKRFHQITVLQESSATTKLFSCLLLCVGIISD